MYYFIVFVFFWTKSFLGALEVSSLITKLHCKDVLIRKENSYVEGSKDRFRIKTIANGGPDKK